jgi:hypothetical protein
MKPVDSIGASYEETGRPQHFLDLITYSLGIVLLGPEHKSKLSGRPRLVEGEISGKSPAAGALMRTHRIFRDPQ